MSAHGEKAGRGFIAHLHAFRGFAILNIVAVHAMNTAVLYVRQPDDVPTYDVVLHSAIETLFHNSTIYFALISGLLFATVLSSRGWLAFFRGKLLNVILPYIFVTILLSMWLWPVTDEDPFYGEPFRGGLGDFSGAVLENLLTGSAMFHMWYMPVLALLFLATPFVAKALKYRSTQWIVFGLVFLPLVVSRIGWEFNWQSTVYFLGAYSLGILIGSDYDRWFGWLERRFCLLGILAILATALIAWFYASEIEFVGPVSVLESAFYVQKLALAGCALVLLKRWESQLPGWLDTVATFAFAIYFLHAPIDFFLPFHTLLDQHPSLLLTLILCAVHFLVALGLSVAISMLVRRLIGRRSRMLIGA